MEIKHIFRVPTELYKRSEVKENSEWHLKYSFSEFDFPTTISGSPTLSLLFSIII